MKNAIRGGILSGVILGSALMASQCAGPNNTMEDVKLEETASTESDIDNGLFHYDVYANEIEFLGDVVARHTIFDILNDRGYSINRYGLLAEGVLEEHDYNEVEQSLGAINDSGVNFRKGPGTEFDIIESLEADAPVEMIAECDNGWVLVQNKGRLGFVRGDYLRDVQFSSAEMSSLPPVVPFVQATTDVNIRRESNTNLPELGLLRKGRMLPFKRYLENGWCEVEYQGQSAYVSGDFVKTVYAVDAKALKIVAINQDCSLYQKPFGDVITDLSQFEAAKVYGEVDNFYYVEADGHVGFVSKNNCSELTDTCVVVDIGDQNLSLYKDGEEILTTSVTTGKDSTPTDIGLFDIDSKERNATLEGPGYSSPVEYWMPYNYGEGLHDAYWRYGVFGGEGYHSNGSHGCVNMDLSDAAEVYDNVSVGDNVLVKR